MKEAKDHVIFTLIVVSMALFGEYAMWINLHECIETLPMSYHIDVLFDALVITILVSPLIYYFFVIRRSLDNALTDYLTGLYNRMYFSKKHDSLIKKNKPFQLMLLDLCNFKEVNDIHGHAIGDEVLRMVSNRLIDAVGKENVARLGGDEFVVMLPGEPGVTVAELIAARIREPIVTHDMELTVSASIGVTNYPIAGIDTKTLMTKADCAMYNAKRNGIDIFVCHPGDGCCNFKPGKHERRANR